MIKHYCDICGREMKGATYKSTDAADTCYGECKIEVGIGLQGTYDIGYDEICHECETKISEISPEEFKAAFEALMNKNSDNSKKKTPAFGDIIYRPCLEYAGRTRFINPQIVTEVFEADNELYIRSVDFVGQEWNDSVHSLGKTIFLSTKEAETKLKEYIDARNKKKMSGRA